MATVLVVDDERNFTEGLRDWFEAKEISAVCALTLAEAESHIKTQKVIDVALLDCQLDGHNRSFALIDQLRNSFPACKLVAMSNHRELQAEQLRQGCDFGVSKFDAHTFALGLLQA